MKIGDGFFGGLHEERGLQSCFSFTMDATKVIMCLNESMFRINGGENRDDFCHMAM